MAEFKIIADDEGLAHILQKLYKERGVEVRDYRYKCLRRRINTRLRARGVFTYKEYIAVLNTVKTRGEVIWQGELGERKEGYYHTGISFSGIKEEDKQRFADFCFLQMYELVGLPAWPTKR